MIRRLAILGPGLLGASLALAARQRGLAREVSVWARRIASCDEALQRHVADAASVHLADAVRGADVVVLATPIPVMAGLAAQLAPHLAPDAVVTDVGSVKDCVVRDVTAALGARAGQFVGSHPMAGSEHSGMAHARADLFENTACVITPGPGTADAATRTVTALWQGVGCRLVTLAPDAHDRAVAAVSHAVHLTAAALVNAAVGADGPGVLQIAGPGFRDSTRVALGPPELWHDILRANTPAVVAALHQIQDEIGAFADALADGQDVTDRLAAARDARRTL